MVRKRREKKKNEIREARTVLFLMRGEEKERKQEEDTRVEQK